jgi:hypothetical protein
MERDERTSFVEPAGVMAMACTPRRPDATRKAPAVIAVRDGSGHSIEYDLPTHQQVARALQLPNISSAPTATVGFLPLKCPPMLSQRKTEKEARRKVVSGQVWE